MAGIGTTVKLALDRGDVATGLNALANQVESGVGVKLRRAGDQALAIWASVGGEIKAVGRALGDFVLQGAKTSEVLGPLVERAAKLKENMHSAFGAGLDAALKGTEGTLNAMMDRTENRLAAISKILGEVAGEQADPRGTGTTGMQVGAAATQGALQGAASSMKELVSIMAEIPGLRLALRGQRSGEGLSVGRLMEFWTGQQYVDATAKAFEPMLAIQQAQLRLLEEAANKAEN